MAELTDELRTEIVVAFAQYKTPSEIVKLLKEEHDLEIDRRKVRTYNPDSPGFEAGVRWIEIFNAARTAYRKDIEGKAIADLGWRLGQLQEMAMDAKRAGNKVLAAALMKQAAEDLGGVYTNQRHVAMDGKIEHSHRLSPAEAKAELARRLAASGLPVPALPASEQIIEQAPGEKL